MEQLNKLIEQAFDDNVSAENMFGSVEILVGKKEFMDQVNEILASRPTCGKEERDYLDRTRKLMQGDQETEFCTENERKFLDRVREIGVISNRAAVINLNASMFPGINLEELVE